LKEIQIQSKKLSYLLHEICSVKLNQDCDVNDITIDSREVVRGSCFFALKGYQQDGVEFIDDAVRNGACAIVSERPPNKSLALSVPLFIYPELKRKLGKIAKRFFESPSESIKVIAVTGTNGKTTVSYLLSQLLSKLGGLCGYVGTLGYGCKRFSNFTQGRNTTPHIFDLNRILYRLHKSGAKYCALEASSIGLSEGRLDGIFLDTAIFTNLGRDHLDYHGTIEDYGKAKLKLFENFYLKKAIINVDDQFGKKIASVLKENIELWRCSTGISNIANKNEFYFEEIGLSKSTTNLRVSHNFAEHAVKNPMVGSFNSQNAILVIAALVANKISIADGINALQQPVSIPGRMEFFGRNKRGSYVYVDYAHTPDALQGALMAIKSITSKRIILVFGCGGSRDVGKRSMMGGIADRYSDKVILTSDNNRTETFESIASDVLSGVKKIKKFTVLSDRRHAIDASLALGSLDDVILIAGKGHEQIIEHQNYNENFSDRAYVANCLRNEND